MSVADTLGLGTELLNAAKAIGVLHADGDPNLDWFEHPMTYLDRIFTDQTQWQALSALIDAFAPADHSVAAPAGELWHPLLTDTTIGPGNVYLTIKQGSGPAAGTTYLGIAAQMQSAGATPPAAALQLHFPLLAMDSGHVNLVIGQDVAPITLELHLALGWTKAGGDPLTLAGIRAALNLTPRATDGLRESLTITLEGFDIDGHNIQDVVLDQNHLGAETLHVVLGLLQQALSGPAGPGGAAGVVTHLLGLLGLGDVSVPPFPISAFASGPAALRTWFTALFTPPTSGDPAILAWVSQHNPSNYTPTPPIQPWLTHLAGLLGVASPSVTGGASGDPWRVQLFSLGTGEPTFDLVVAAVTPSGATAPTLQIGFEIALRGSGALSQATGQVRVTLAAIPLAGVNSATILPEAALLIVSPQPLVNPIGRAGSGASPLVVQSLRGGITWDGATLKPLLELDGVNFLGTQYPVIDLTHINSSSIGTAFASAARAALGALLGMSDPPGATGPAQHLGALACLITPALDSSWPYLLDDIAAFVAHPTQVLAQKHRAALIDPGHPWSAMLGEIAALLRLPSGPTGMGARPTLPPGSGTKDDPWCVIIDEVGPVSIELAAWNAQADHSSGVTQQLRLGFRVHAVQTPWDGTLLAEVLAFDLPANGEASVSVIGKQRLALTLSPVPIGASVAGISLGVDSVEASLDWQPGHPVQALVTLDNVEVSSADGDVHVGQLQFPPAGSFDFDHFLTSSGLSRPDAESLLRLLLANAMHAWGGMAGYAVSGLLGINGSLPGFPARLDPDDMPTGSSLPDGWLTLTDVAPGTLLSNPTGALGEWVRAIATGVAADGQPLLPPALEWLRALLANALPGGTDSMPQFAIPTDGSGTREDPWALPLTTAAGAQTVEALVWLEPDGPPATWAQWLRNQADSITGFGGFLTLVGRLAPFVPQVRDALRECDLGALGDGLSALSAYLDGSDGVVPTDSQTPSWSGWAHGTAIQAAHPNQPGNSSTIRQIQSRLNTWASTTSASSPQPMAVLLLGPAFSDHSVWRPLADEMPANTCFNFRQPGIDPSVVDVGGVTAVAQYYPVDLADDGSGNTAVLVAQIARAVERVQAVCPSGTLVFLVAHSTAGLAATAYAASSASPPISGLITVGTPHQGTSLVPLRDRDVAAAVRFLQRLLLTDQPAGLPAGEMRDALAHWAFALDGYHPSPVDGSALPTPAPYPRGVFSSRSIATTPPVLNGIPALALGGTIHGTTEPDLLMTLRSWLASAINNVASSAGSASATGTNPGYLAVGVRVGLAAPSSSSPGDPADVSDDLVITPSVRMDLWRHSLQASASSTAGVPSGTFTRGPIGIRLALTRPGGWLLGAASAYHYPEPTDANPSPGFDLVAPVESARARWAEIGLDVHLPPASGVSVTPVLRFFDGAFQGTTYAKVELTDGTFQRATGAAVASFAAQANAQVHALLGTLLQQLSTPTPANGTPAAALLSALQALGIAVDDPHGGVGIAADALAALATDPIAYLAPRLRTALAHGLTGIIPGLTESPSGQWTLAGPPLGQAAPADSFPIRLVLVADPWTLRLETTPLITVAGGSDSSDGIVLGTLPLSGGAVGLQGSVSLPLATLAPAAEVSLAAGPLTLAWSTATHSLTLQAPPFLDAIRLVPAPDAATVGAAINGAAPALLVSSAVSMLAQALAGSSLGGQFTMGPIANFLAAPGQFLLNALAVSPRTPDAGFDATKVNDLLALISQALDIPSPSSATPPGLGSATPPPGLMLPAGLELSASGGGSSPLILTLQTTAAIAGVVEASLALSIDHLLHATPSTSYLNLTLALPDLPGTSTLPASWGQVKISFGVGGPQGVTLSITPHVDASPQPQPIQILPTFSGLGALLGDAEALLPSVLNATLTAVSPAPPASGTLLDYILQMAEVLDLYDATNKFSGHDAAWRALLQGDWLHTVQSDTVVVTHLISHLADALRQMGVPVANHGSSIAWSPSLSGTGGITGGTLTLDVGWDGVGPLARPLAHVHVDGLALGNHGPTVSLSAGYVGGVIVCSFDAGLDMEPLVGLQVAPKLSFGLAGGHFTATLLPLGETPSGTDLAVTLLPDLRITPDPSGTAFAEHMVSLAMHWVVPLAAKLAWRGLSPHLLSEHVWAGGPTLSELLIQPNLFDATGTLQHPPSTLLELAGNLLQAVETAATHAHISVGETLTLSISSDGTGRYGVEVTGFIAIPLGAMQLKLGLGRFANPSTSAGGTGSSDTAPDGSVTLWLITIPSPASTPPSSISLTPGLALERVGVELTGANDAALLDTAGFRLGGVGGFISLAAELSVRTGALTTTLNGAGIDIAGLGLPIGQALSGGTQGNPSNPVVASLLNSSGSNGSGSSSGDHQAVNPAIDVSVWYENHQVHIRFGNTDEPLWIGVHQGFGPIFIDQIGVSVNQAAASTAVELIIDGGVHVSAFTAQVDELSVTIPLTALSNARNWTLDLHGLAVAYSANNVSLAGGLIKQGTSPNIEYDGMLLGDIVGRGLAVIGSYGAITDASGQFSALFVFAALDAVIGGPPFLFITGLGGGLGYNRRLLVPTDVLQVPQFLLVEAIDDQSIAANPMGALTQMRNAMPAQRGSLWLAAGIKFDTFVVVHSVAALYVSLDRGVDIGLLGVSRMQLPSADFTLVNVELALRARYSTTEGILSVQAQLTDNSWLLNQDCKLTGGFAFFIWFPQAQFVLTLGGYHPAFQKPSQFPDVPRLGFHWAISSALVIKGESYFALTTSCVMAGARLEATFETSAVRAWFSAYADFLVSWDPFHYDIAIGVSIGASVFGITLSLGASLHIVGPALHGEVSVQLEVCTVTFAFGDPADASAAQLLDWTAFKAKYLVAGSSETDVVAVRVAGGLLPIEGGGNPPQGESLDHAWQMAPEFAFLTETRMAALTYATFVEEDLAHTPVEKTDRSVGAHSLSIAPMGKALTTSRHTVTLMRQQDDGSWVDISVSGQPSDWQSHFQVAAVISNLPEATWHHTDQLRASANTVPAVTGVRISAVAVANNRSANIPIQTLVDDIPSESLQLPFPSAFDTERISLGLSAEQMIALAVSATPEELLRAAHTILAGNGRFALARSQTGRPANGIPAMAALALRAGRAAPPLIAPMATGFAQRSVALPAPIPIRRTPVSAPIYLNQPRLAAVLQPRPAEVNADVVAIQTTVKRVAPTDTPRMKPPGAVDVPGARLERVVPATAPRPTAAAVGTWRVRNAESSALVTAAQRSWFGQTETDALAGGARLTAGMTQLWDVPLGNPSALPLTIRGDSAARVTCLGLGGNVLLDRELVATPAGISIAAPDATVMLVVTCLGDVPPGFKSGEGLGAITARANAIGTLAVTGWQSENLFPQVGPTTLLARGAVLRCARRVAATDDGASTSQAMTRVADMIRDQPGIETWLPLSTDVVMVLLDQHDPAAASEIKLATQGGRLINPPEQVTVGKRTALLYTVAQRDDSATALAISIASGSGWHLAGVLGLAGRASEWAKQLSGKTPRTLVTDGALTASGQISVQFGGGRA
jgi:hypothetical protein